MFVSPGFGLCVLNSCFNISCSGGEIVRKVSISSGDWLKGKKV